MICRHRLTLPLKAVIASIALAAVMIGLAVDGRDAPPAGADPAFGQVRVPSSQSVVIVGHSINVPVSMTTCTDNQTIPSGTVTSSATTTMTDSTKTWTSNQWAGYDVQITSGTGSPQWRVVASNTSNTLTLTEAWGDIVDTGTANGGSDTTLVDPGSNWLTNEFAGMTLEMPSLGSGQTRIIASNTADTLTIDSVAPPAGAAPWTTHVTDPAATGGTSNTLTDSASWTVNQWSNKTQQITGGAASGQSRRIASNTSSTLTIDGTWTTADGGTATAATSDTLSDVSQAWTVNAFNGMTIEILSGAGAGQVRTISSNTATQVTVSSNWTTTPAFGDAYRILQVPNATSQYVIRDGPAIGTQFQIKQNVLPGVGAGYQIFKSACRPAGHDLTISYNDTRWEVASDAGLSTGGNTSTTLNDTTKAWKINQWAGTRINITGGAGLGQTRVVVSNTATQIVVSPAWTSPQPTNGSVYNVGGFQDGGFVTSTGRTLNCPGGTTYGSNFAEIHCVTLGTPPNGLPQAATGTGNLGMLSLKALTYGPGTTPITITAQVLETDGTVIPADVISGFRRIILCPDSGPPLAPDGRITSIDFGVMAQAFGHTPTTPPPPNNKYTPQKDPSMDNVISSIDQGIMAQVFNQYCNQP